MNLKVNGEPRPPVGPQTDSIDLEWNRTHTLLFSNECCFEKELQIGPQHEEALDGNRLRVVLTGKPAFLTVRTEPSANGRVLIRETDRSEEEELGKPIQTSGPLGQQIHVSFAGDRDMRKTLALTIDIPGRDPKNVEVEIRAGEKKTVPVKLGD